MYQIGYDDKRQAYHEGFNARSCVSEYRGNRESPQFGTRSPSLLYREKQCWTPYFKVRTSGNGIHVILTSRKIASFSINLVCPFNVGGEIYTTIGDQITRE